MAVRRGGRRLGRPEGRNCGMESEASLDSHGLPMMNTDEDGERDMIGSSHTSHERLHQNYSPPS